MEYNLQNAFSEICEILNLMEKQYVDKVPKKIKELFENEKNNEYKCKIDINVPLENQKLQKETLTILAILYINYWYENEEERQELIKNFDNVDKQNEERYSIDNIFKQKNKNIGIIEEKSLVEYKENFLLKLINKLKRLFIRKDRA